MNDAGWNDLRHSLADLFAEPFAAPPADELFNERALRVFMWQFEHNITYRRFCERRGRTPSTLQHWTEIPPVPTAAFREAVLVAGRADGAEAVFRTSGTTAGAERRGTHYIPDVSLYHAALLPNFRASVLPDGAVLRMFSLVPAAAELPDSSLAHMIDVVMQTFGAPGSACLASIDGGVDDDGLRSAIVAAVADGAPVALLGTSFAFVHWLDLLEMRREFFELPAGSRIMDTGGFKGRSREVSADEMLARYSRLLNVPPSHCINEYGMTEMCSQFYDAVLRLPGNDRSTPRIKSVPAWVRTRVVDPATLEPVTAGDVGILQHFDLANAGSVMAVQTEDLGLAAPDGFRVLGRAPGAVPRGCSIAMDVLLETLGRRRAE